MPQIPIATVAQAQAAADAAQTAATAAASADAQARIDALISAAPGTLDTLNELAAALGDDPNFAATTAASIAARLTQTQADALYRAVGLIGTGDLADGAVTAAKSALAAADVGAAPAAHTTDVTAHGGADGAANVATRRTLGTGPLQAAAGSDSRLSDARPPTLHSASHASGGTDPVSPSSIGALSSTTVNSFASAATNALRTQVTADGFPRHALTAAGERFSGDGAAAAVLAGFTRSVDTAWGRSALASATSGASNSAFGGNALLSNTTGSFNVAVGAAAMQGSTSGSFCVAVGTDALFSSNASRNIALGHRAARQIVTGGNNVAIGTEALRLGTAVSNTVAIGDAALFGVTSSDHAAVGCQAGYAPANQTANQTTSGLRQTLFGFQTGQASATQRDDVVAVGYRALVDGNNSVAIGSGAQCLHAGSVALGQGSVTTLINQVFVGSRNLEFAATGFGPVLRSPDAARWRITVDNLGALTAVAA